MRIAAVIVLLLATVSVANCARTISRDRIQVDTPYGSLLLSDVTLVQESSSEMGHGWPSGEITFRASLTNGTDRAWTSLSLIVVAYDKHKHRLPPSETAAGVTIARLAKGETRNIKGTVSVLGDGLLGSVRKIESFDVQWSPTSSFHWTYVFSLQSPTGALGANDLRFEDALTSLVFVVQCSQISFVMRNKTGSAVSVVWNQSSIVDLQQISRSVIHSGTKFFNNDSSQVPTLIPPGTSIQESVIPSDAVKFLKLTEAHDMIPANPDKWFETSSQREGWFITPFLPTDFNGALKSKGGSFGLFLSLDTASGRREYLFKFLVNDVRVETDFR